MVESKVRRFLIGLAMFSVIILLVILLVRLVQEALQKTTLNSLGQTEGKVPSGGTVTTGWDSPIYVQPALSVKFPFYMNSYFAAPWWAIGPISWFVGGSWKVKPDTDPTKALAAMIASGYLSTLNHTDEATLRIDPIDWLNNHHEIWSRYRDYFWVLQVVEN